MMQPLYHNASHCLPPFIPALIAVTHRFGMMAPHPSSQLNCPRAFLIQRPRMYSTVHLILRQVQPKGSGKLAVLWANYCLWMEGLLHHLGRKF